jgi:hypothetical protein
MVSRPMEGDERRLAKKASLKCDAALRCTPPAEICKYNCWSWQVGLLPACMFNYLFLVVDSKNKKVATYPISLQKSPCCKLNEVTCIRQGDRDLRNSILPTLIRFLADARAR